MADCGARRAGAEAASTLRNYLKTRGRRVRVASSAAKTHHFPTVRGGSSPTMAYMVPVDRTLRF